MTPVYQTRRGTEGNCWAACLATLFDVSLDEVDHCGAPHSEWWNNSQEFLAKHGLFYVEAPLTKDDKGGDSFPFTVPPHGTHLIVGCMTTRGLRHAVVGRLDHTKDAEGNIVGWELYVVHDPFPGGSEIKSFDAIILLCRLEK